MKTFRRLVCFAFAVALCLSIMVMPVSAAEDDSKMLAQAKKGVGQILTIVYAGDKTSGIPMDVCSGTGFAVGKENADANVFVTNWHVATCGGYDPGCVRVYLLLDDWYLDENLIPQNAVECEILYVPSDNGGVPDYAILKTMQDVTGFKALPLCPSNEIASGTPVYALGYPGAITELNSTMGSGIDDITITSGVVSQHMDMDVGASQPVNVLVHDAQVSRGNSGGPLVDAKGRVVGINTYSYEQLGYAMAVNTQYVIDRLDLLGLPYSLGSNAGLSRNTVIYIVLGIVAAAAVAVIIVTLTKGKKSKEDANPIWLKAPNGSMIAIGSASMEIGRLPSCQICMSDNTKGVSRKHCTVVQRDGVLVLTDVGSSGGTFVNGVRIGVNVPVTVPKGSSFFLGSPSSNQFMVC